MQQLVCRKLRWLPDPRRLHSHLQEVRGDDACCESLRIKDRGSLFREVIPWLACEADSIVELPSSPSRRWDRLLALTHARDRRWWSPFLPIWPCQTTWLTPRCRGRSAYWRRALNSNVIQRRFMTILETFQVESPSAAPADYLPVTNCFNTQAGQYSNVLCDK